MRLAGAARIERDRRFVAKGTSFDADKYPHVLHLTNGEIIPCHVTSYDKTTLGFRSPFINQRKIDSAHVKAIEFTPSMSGDSDRESSSEIDDWLKEVLGPEQKASPGIDPVKLERALTVPRFNRDTPPSHLLVAKTGDLKRGSLLGISGQMIQFESKLRKQTIPVERMARVVNVSKPEDELDQQTERITDLTDRVRATLSDGSIMIFTAIESKDGKLVGHSAIYGKIALPTKSLQYLNLGDFGKEQFKSLFDEWVVHPAKEPEFSKPSPPVEHQLKSEGPAASSPVAAPPAANQTSDVGPRVAVNTPLEGSGIAKPRVDRQAPDLGKVRIDAKDRSLRFPVSINQRSGLVEYAVVTGQGKTHESVFRTDTEPTHIHLGLLLLGATPSYARKLPTDLSRNLPGERVFIDVAWTESGVERSKPLGDFVVTTDNAATLAPGPWVYNGSVLIKHGIAAQTEGSIVSLWLDPSALINNPRPGRWNDELHHANPQAFPADSTGLQMVVRLGKNGRLPGSGMISGE
ncbi:MAG: YdjY domain-containing protein [Proteobacteria bacterium]|nr:YdjY domain-containing protein [Pseudomonadota bacterium]